MAGQPVEQRGGREHGGDVVPADDPRDLHGIGDFSNGPVRGCLEDGLVVLEHGEGVGNFYAIDASKRGDITQTGRVWHFTKVRRSISTAAVIDGLVYISDFSGFLYCLDANTGKEIWMHDHFAAVWGSPFVVDGKVYIGDEDGDVTVLAHGREKKVLAEMNMGSSVYATVTPAHGTIFLNNRNQLFAIANK